MLWCHKQPVLTQGNNISTKMNGVSACPPTNIHRGHSTFVGANAYSCTGSQSTISQTQTFLWNVTPWASTGQLKNTGDINGNGQRTTDLAGHTSQNSPH